MLQSKTPQQFFLSSRKGIFIWRKKWQKFILMRWGGLNGLIFYFPRWSENLLNCYWQAENRPKHYIVIKWSWTPNHDSGCGFFGWFARFFLRKSRESSAKAVAKEKVSMEASSPHSTFAAASQGNVVNNETLLFPWWNLPNMALHLP